MGVLESNGMTARHSHATVEHHTPPFIADGARYIFGNIDIDPASCIAANKLVRADRIITKARNGYLSNWRGTKADKSAPGYAFVNPPGGWCDETGHEVIRAVKGKHEACTVTGACGLPTGHTHVGVTSSSVLWWYRAERAVRDGEVPGAFVVLFSAEQLQTTLASAREGAPTPLDMPLCWPRSRGKPDLNGKPWGKVVSHT